MVEPKQQSDDQAKFNTSSVSRRASLYGKSNWVTFVLPVISAVFAAVAGAILLFLVARKTIDSPSTLSMAHQNMQVVFALCVSAVVFIIGGLLLAKLKHDLHFYSVQTTFFLCIVLTILAVGSAFFTWRRLGQQVTVSSIDCKSIEENQRHIIASSVTLQEFGESGQSFVQMGTLINTSDGLFVITPHHQDKLNGLGTWIFLLDGSVIQKDGIELKQNGEFPLLMFNVPQESTLQDMLTECGEVNPVPQADSVVIGGKLHTITQPERKLEGTIISRRRVNSRNVNSTILYTNLPYHDNSVGMAVFDEDGIFVGLVLGQNPGNGTTMIQTISDYSVRYVN